MIKYNKIKQKYNTIYNHECYTHIYIDEEWECLTMSSVAKTDEP